MAMSADAAKRELDTLLRNFRDNIGTAEFICGEPLKFLPASERERIENGFCTPENEKVFTDSRKSLEAASRYAFPETELKRIADAKETLDRFIPLLSSFIAKQIKLDEFKEKVRAALRKPLPKGETDCLQEMSRLMGIVKFLAEEKIEEKDRWDQMIDCSQMHDVLTRIKELCKTMHGMKGDSQENHQSALDRTLELSNDRISQLESFFRGEMNPKTVQQNFKTLAAECGKLWPENTEGHH